MLLTTLLPFAQIVLALLAFWLVFALLRIAREAGAAHSAFAARRQPNQMRSLSRRTDP
jgi:hypothetical protein